MRGSGSIFGFFLAGLLVACSGEVTEPNEEGTVGPDAGVAPSCPEQRANRGALLLDGHTGSV